MAIQVPPIAGILGLDTDPFAKGMLRAESIMRLFPASVQSFLASPLLGAIDIAKQVGSTLVDAFTSATEHADKVGDMAANLGVGVEFLSGMGLVARQAGSSLEGVAVAIQFLNKNASEAAQDVKGQTAAAFRELGIEVTDAFGQLRPAEQLLPEVADGLAAVVSPADRTRLAMQLMGRSGTEMIATLTQGSEAIEEQIERYKRWGAVVTEESVRTADKWQDAMGDITIAWEGVKERFGEQLRISLLPELEKVIDWIDAHQDDIKQFVREMVGEIKALIPPLKEVLGVVLDIVKLVPILTDALGITDPHTRFDRPYTAPSNMKSFEGITPQSLMAGGADAGVVGLQKIERMEMLLQQSAKRLPDLVSPSPELRSLNIFHWQSAVSPAELARQQAHLENIAAKAEARREQLDTLSTRLAVGEAVPQEEIDAAVRDFLQFVEALSVTQAQVRGIISGLPPHMAEDARLLRDRLTESVQRMEIVRQEAAELGGFLNVSAMPATQRMSEEFRGLTESSRRLQQEMDDAVDRLRPLFGFETSGGSSATTQPASVVLEMNGDIKLDNLDVSQASSEMAGIINQALRRHVENQMTLVRSASRAAAMRGGI